MGLAPNLLSSCALCFFLLFPALCVSQDTYNHSRATYYGSPDGLGTPSGACGYGDFGRTVNGGVVAAASSRLYKNGVGCGACYQVKCTIPQLCTKDGVTVVVTDNGEGDHTDFILSPRAFANLARPKLASKLKSYGVVDIEYQRVSCNYPGHNLMFKVHENSRFPDYLAIDIIYKGGRRDITAVELLQEDRKHWRALRNAYGAVWDMPNPPKGSLTFKFRLRGDGGQQWEYALNAIPSYWEAGVAYDSGFQLYI